MAKKTSKGRPHQPKCPKKCGKAFYKRMDKGQVRKSDPYAWCRNKKCSEYNQDQTGGQSRFKPIPVKVKGIVIKTIHCPPDPIEQAVKKAMKEDPEQEPEAVTKARNRIRDVLKAVEAKFGTNAVGLALAIVSQETGSDEAANALIAEYRLSELYGIQQRD